MPKLFIIILSHSFTFCQLIIFLKRYLCSMDYMKNIFIDHFEQWIIYQARKLKHIG